MAYEWRIVVYPKTWTRVKRKIYVLKDIDLP